MAEQKKRPGRPTKRTSGLVRALCSVLSAGGTRTAAVGLVGIDISTFHLWLENPEFSGQVARAEAEAETRFTQVLYEAALAGDWKPASFWLERRRPADYGPRTQIDTNVTGDLAEVLAKLFGGQPDVDPKAALPPPPQELSDAELGNLPDATYRNGHTNGASG